MQFLTAICVFYEQQEEQEVLKDSHESFQSRFGIKVVTVSFLGASEQRERSLDKGTATRFKIELSLDLKCKNNLYP